MILIIILLALALDFFLGNLDRFRQFNWFISLHYILEKRFSHLKFWDGSFGLLGLVAIPLLTLLSLLCLLN